MIIEHKSNQPQGVIMSYNPERISSYRRRFESGLASSSPSLQSRVSSPSSTQWSNRGFSSYNQATSYNRNTVVGSKALPGSRSRVQVTGMRARYLSRAAGAGAGAGAGDLDAASAENQAFLNTRTSEKQEMITLNDRLTKYIEKVRSLESQNKTLETEIETMQNRFNSPSGLHMLYEERLREMRRVADQMMAQRDLAVAAKDAMGVQVEMLKARYSEALEAHKKAERDIEAVRPDVDAATAGRITLEKQLDNLEHQREFLQRVHKQEIEELKAQLYSWMAKGDMAFALPNLGTAFKSIQAQYDSMASKKLQEMDTWYKTQFQGMSQKSTRRVESICSAREEIKGLKTEICSQEWEVDRLRTRNEVLEAKLRDATERYRNEEETLQARIDTFNQELSAIKGKITVTLKEYQDLLNVKKSLEMEITTYRKLIEGEDSRMNSMVSSLPLMGSAGMMALESASSVSASIVSATEKRASLTFESASVTNGVSNGVNGVSNGVSEVLNGVNGHFVEMEPKIVVKTISSSFPVQQAVEVI
ncbi:glial fibrillary acidic protein-like [Engraulis encrasicolus]|uniref:glial fibrillary acidic protein-like n=1 Tax=Engraulis encrasicolus TaxID=184585 RepID=UPI002FD134A1